MGLMGTLAKVAIGYAAAKGMDKMRDSGGLQNMMQQMSGGAQAGAGGLQDMMGQMMGGAQGGAANLQDMMGKMMGGAGAGAGSLQDMMSQMMGGGTATSEPEKGGLLSNLGGAGGAGLAGILAMAGGAAAMGGDGVNDMLASVGQEKASDEMERNAGVMLRAIIQAAKADGEIDADEQARIMDTVGEDADAEDIAFVREQLAAPVSVEALAADTPNGAEAQVYAMSLMSIRVDTPAEVAYLTDLADALRLPKSALDMVHAQMGVPPLPA